MSSPRPRRKRILASASAAGLALAAAAAPALAEQAPAAAQETADSAVVIGIDPSYQQPEFEGWGTSLVWMANATGGYPDEIRERLVDMVFGEEGLNLNIARYNVGGGNAPDIDSSYMKDGADMPGWWAAPEGVTHEDKDWWDPENPDHWNWDADANQRWWIDQIKDDVTHWEAFSNSPPYFQTVSGYVSGGFDASDEQIRADTVDEFAIYMTEVMEHLEDAHGIEFDTVNPLNEPNTDYWGTTLGPDGVQPVGGRQEGAHAGPELQQLVIQALAEQLEDADTDAVVSAMDETNPGTFTANWNAYTDESRAVVEQMNVHTYGTGNRTSVRDLAKGGDKPLWMSEVGGSWHSPTDYETMDEGLGIADRITDDLRELEPSAWVFWQPIEDTIPQQEGGGNWGSIHIPFDCTAEDTLETCPIQTNTKYDAVRNFTHYIEPGDHMVKVDDIDTVAAVKDSEDAAVVVYTNHSADSRAVTLDLSKFGGVDSGATVTPVVTSADGALVEGEPVRAEGTSPTLTVPGESVTTFLIDGVSGVAEDAALAQDGHVYRIEGVQSGKSLAPDAEGAGTVIATTDPSSLEQLWEVEQLTEGHGNREHFAVVNVDTGQRLAVREDDSLVLEDAGGDPDAGARWMMSTTGDGTWTFVNVGTGRLIDVGGQATEDGSPVATYTPTSGANQRWAVIDETVQDLLDVEAYTVPGLAPELPETVTPVYRDGPRGELAVTWKHTGHGKWKRPGTVEVKGTAYDVLGDKHKVTAVVTVDTFSSTEPASAKTYVGGEPDLPEAVTAIGDHGGRVAMPVTWEEAPEGAFDELGTVTLSGTAHVVDGSTVPAVVEVEVTEPVEVNAAMDDGVTTAATFTEDGYSTERLRNGNLSDKAWSNWVSGDKRTEDAITFTLPAERDVTRVVAYFYSDGGRASYADTMQVQYLAEDGTWVDAGEPVAVGTDPSPVVDVAVDARTSAVRVQMSVGEVGWITMSEIEVYAKAPSA
ncbi:Ig-like domain-containing protein [Glycomyces arizonensis]|uniref:Ig-like domain-containing protein n=1 Tax=Glycomyces arizonensis TaxID=256035 RepID=UPI00041E519F|nr:glycoside hydrolase [Glycomyces arizonensis]